MSRRDRPAKRWLGLQPGPQNPIDDGLELFTISGYVEDGNGDGIEGVEIEFVGIIEDAVYTDDDGFFYWDEAVEGDYTVTPTKDGIDFVPENFEVTVSDSDVSVPAESTSTGFPAFQQPYVENFESDTPGDDEATIAAKVTHYEVGYTGATVQAIDYSTLPAIARTDFTQCITAQQIAYQGLLLSAGEGFTPSDGNVVLIEGVFWCTGTGSQMEIYARDADLNDGILVGYVINGNTFLDTIHSGNTRKLNGTDGISTVPHQSCWAYFGVQYNQSNNQVYTRVIEFGAALSEDSGWVSMGTVASPTFNNDEWVYFQCISRSDTSALQGVAQCRVGDSVVDGYGLGQLETHNYRAP